MRHFALALAGLVCSFSASAAIVTFEYTGIVNTIRQSPTGNYSDSRSVASTTAVPGGVAVGDTYRGSFTFDLGTPNTSNDPSNGYYWGWQSQDAISATFDKSGTVLKNLWSPSISVTNSTTDSLSVLGSFQGGYMHLWLVDLSGKAFSDVAQPVSLSANDFYTAELDLTWFASEGSPYVNVETSVLSITRVSPVPEPSTFALLFAGLAVVGGAAARKRVRAARG